LLVIEYGTTLLCTKGKEDSEDRQDRERYMSSGTFNRFVNACNTHRDFVGRVVIVEWNGQLEVAITWLRVD